MEKNNVQMINWDIEEMNRAFIRASKAISNLSISLNKLKSPRLEKIGSKYYK